MNVLNPYVRQFLVGWITCLDSVPEIDMLGFLPDFLDGNIPSVHINSNTCINRDRMWTLEFCRLVQHVKWC